MKKSTGKVVQMKVVYKRPKNDLVQMIVERLLKKQFKIKGNTHEPQ